MAVKFAVSLIVLPIRTLRFSAHSMSFPLTNSEPLSTRLAWGFPRHSIIWFSAHTTFLVGSEKSTLMVRPRDCSHPRCLKS